MCVCVLSRSLQGTKQEMVAFVYVCVGVGVCVYVCVGVCGWVGAQGAEAGGHILPALVPAALQLPSQTLVFRHPVWGRASRLLRP